MRRKLAAALSVAVLLAVPKFLKPAYAEWTGPASKALFANEANPKGYNYAPSVITENGTTDFWWCGQGKTDVIFHRSYSPQTGFSPAQVVFQPTSGSWNQLHVCDPSVIKGSFANPADGQRYTYAMYYSGVDNAPGNNNQTGLAFSNDKINWANYPKPVISPLNPAVAQGNYGNGQPATINVDGRSSLLVFTTDLSGPQGIAGFGDLYVRHTADGVNFNPPIRIPNEATDGTTVNPNSDLAYDSAKGDVYVITGLPGRNCQKVTCKDPARNPDRETYQLGLYKMPLKALLSGTPAKWFPVGYLNSDVTGFYLNHSPGFQRDPYGNLTPFLPNITVFFSGGDPYPGTWQIATATETNTSERVPLKRTLGSNGHWVTTGYTDPSYAFEANVGSLFLLPRFGTSKLMSCVAGSDHFLSRDLSCEGQTPLGQTGYVYDNRQRDTHPIYRCNAAAHDHFVSTDPTCEGQTSEGLLGFALN